MSVTATAVALPRHLKVTGVAPAVGYERCEDTACVVDLDGSTSSCGRLACPACGCGGTNLTGLELVHYEPSTRVGCTCGHSWVVAVRGGHTGRAGRAHAG